MDVSARGAGRGRCVGLTQNRTRGATAAIFAVALPVLLLAVGLSVDVGQLVLAKARLQNAADLAALAGAAVVSMGPTAAQQAGANYFAANLCGGTDTLQPIPVGFVSNGAVYRIGRVQITVRCPYSSSRGAALAYPASRTVCVEAENTVNTPFMALARRPTVRIRARAVAASKAWGGAGIFAKQNRSTIGPGWGGPEGDEPSLDKIAAVSINSSRLNIAGGIHANGEVQITYSQGRVTGPVEYRYRIHLGGSTVQFDSGYAQGQELDYPITVTRADIDPGVYDYYYSGDFVIFRSTTTIPSGRYRVRGNMIAGSPQNLQINNCVIIVDGHVVFTNTQLTCNNTTIYAEGSIRFNGGNVTWNGAAVRDICLMSNLADGGAIWFIGGTRTFRGTLFAPRGILQFAGNPGGSLTVNGGGLLAKWIMANNCDLTVNVSGPGGATAARLIE